MKQQLKDMLTKTAADNQPEERPYAEATPLDSAIVVALHKQAAVKGVKPTQRYIWKGGKRVQNPAWKTQPKTQPKADAAKLDTKTTAATGRKALLTGDLK